MNLEFESTYESIFDRFEKQNHNFSKNNNNFWSLYEYVMNF